MCRERRAAVSASAAGTVAGPNPISASNCCCTMRSRSQLVSWVRARVLETWTSLGGVSSGLKCAVTRGNHCFWSGFFDNGSHFAPRK